MLVSQVSSAEIFAITMRNDGSSVMLSDKQCTKKEKGTVVFSVSENGKVNDIGCAIDQGKAFIWVVWQDNSSYFYMKSLFKPFPKGE